MFCFRTLFCFNIEHGLYLQEILPIMNTQLTTQQFGKRLAGLRKLKGFSQEDLARFLAIPRSSVAQMELGNRNVSVTELITLSEVLGFSVDKFLSADYKVEVETNKIEEPVLDYQQTRNSIPVFRQEKVKNILLYILEKCGGKPNVGETVLYKLLYFADFNFYEIYEEHLTGSQYRKLPFGPVPQKIESILNQMLKDLQLQRLKIIYHDLPQTRYIPLVKPDLMKMTAAEKDVIDKVVDRFSDWSASAISEYSHKDMPWKATDDGDLIDYELVFYRESQFSARVYDDESERP
jgi:transcriptional regulator with XRE-family HTH domain